MFVPTFSIASNQ